MQKFDSDSVGAILLTPDPRVEEHLTPWLTSDLHFDPEGNYVKDHYRLQP